MDKVTHKQKLRSKRSVSHRNVRDRLLFFNKNTVENQFMKVYHQRRETHPFPVYQLIGVIQGGAVYQKT